MVIRVVFVGKNNIYFLFGSFKTQASDLRGCKYYPNVSITIQRLVKFPVKVYILCYTSSYNSALCSKIKRPSSVLIFAQT